MKRLHTAPHRAAATGHDAAGDNDAKQNRTQGHGGADIFTTLLSVPQHERPRDHANTQTSRGAGRNGGEPRTQQLCDPEGKTPGAEPWGTRACQARSTCSQARSAGPDRSEASKLPPVPRPPPQPPSPGTLGPWDPGTQQPARRTLAPSRAHGRLSARRIQPVFLGGVPTRPPVLPTLPVDFTLPHPGICWLFRRKEEHVLS